MGRVDIYANRSSISSEFKKEFERLSKLANDLKDAKDGIVFESQAKTLRNLALKQINILQELLEEPEIKLPKK